MGVEAQIVTSHTSLPQPQLTKPQKGGEVRDPVFNSTIIRLTDSREAGLEGAFPDYSKRQAWNCDETILMLRSGSGQTLLLDGRNYEYINTLEIGGEDLFWHPTDPQILLYNPDNTLREYNIRTGEDRIIHKFAEFDFANTRGEGNLSADGRYYALAGQTYNARTGEVQFRQLILFDIFQKVELSRLELPANLEDFDWVSVSPKGEYIVVDYANMRTGAFNGVEVYDRQFRRIWQRPLGSGHSDLGIDADGEEVLVMGYYDDVTNTNYIRKYRLKDGQETTLLSMHWSFYNHISCRNEIRSEWCLVSTYDGEGRLTDSNETWLPFEDEILAVKLDGSGEVQRLAHHRSRRFSPETPDSDNSVYFAEPHATFSRAGNRVLYGSNWREDVSSVRSVDAYVLDIRGLLGGDFFIQAEPQSVSVSPGSEAKITILTGSINQFATPIALSAAFQPQVQGLQVAFSNSLLEPGQSSEATVKVAAEIQAARYLLQVTGASAGLAHRAIVVVEVGGAPDFGLRMAQNEVRLRRGQTVEVGVLIVRTGGFTGRVQVVPLNARQFRLKITPETISVAGTEASFRIKAKTKARTGELQFEARDEAGRVRTASLRVIVED